MTKITNIPTLNPAEFSARAEKVYEAIKADLEEEYRDDFVAIEPDSGEYFLGKDQMEAIGKAKEKHPAKIFYLIKIGQQAVHTMSSHFQPINYGSVF